MRQSKWSSQLRELSASKPKRIAPFSSERPEVQALSGRGPKTLASRSLNLAIRGLGIERSPQKRAVCLAGSVMREDSGAGLVAQENCPVLEEYRKKLQLSQECLLQVVEEFESQMDTGLQEDSNLLMIPTMVDVIPDGHEAGDLYGIEFGGSKIRIVHTRLPKDRHEVETVQIKEILIPDERKKCSADDLFCYIVQHVIDFAASAGRNLQQIGEITVGFCFSFPVQHMSIKSGKVIKWTKGFQNEGAVDQDPVALLRAAFKRQGVDASIEALLNDTVGVLCATRYTAGPDANIAVVMGTGTNACYVEQIRNIQKYRPKYFTRTPDMVVNIEWPGFHSHVFELLEEDVQLDAESCNTGDQAFEKLTAGLYMGDIARRILQRVSEREEWFGSCCQKFGDASKFRTVELAKVAQDDSQDLDVVASVLADIASKDPAEIPFSIRQQAKEICYLVTKRSAQLIAASIVGILHHIERSQRHTGHVPRNIIAVDGNIFTEYHLYRRLLQEAVCFIAGQTFADNFELRMTKGGASFGAATLAAAGARYERVMGRGSQPKTPERKFPPRGKSHLNLAASS